MTGDDLEATIFAFLADVKEDDLAHRQALSDFLLWVRRREVKAPCPYDPRELAGAPIGQYHCPVCGKVVIAGLAHEGDGDEEDERNDDRN